MRDRVLWLGCLAYALLFTWLGVVKYAAHRNLVDFGIFEQTVASAFGCFCNPLEGSHWAFHFSPVLYLAGAAVFLAHSPVTLIALQAVFAALCAPPVYGIVRAHGRDVTTARLCALVVWLYPPLAGLAFGDFHENAFAPAAVAWTLYAFDTGALRLAALAALFTLAIKEDQAIFLACAGVIAGIFYAHDARRMRFAFAVAAVSVAIAALFFIVIQPHANANPGWQPQRFYAWTRADLGNLLLNGLPQRIAFLLLIFAPLGLLPLRTRALALAAVPLAEVLLSRMSTTFTLGTHYAGAWIGYVLVAFAAGAAHEDQRSARRALTWAIALCAVELLFANPLHPGLNLRPVQERDRALDAGLTRLPPDASVATQEEAYTHLALDDPSARLLPETADQKTQACLVLLDWDYPDSPRLQEYAKPFALLVDAGKYVTLDRSGGIAVYRRADRCR